MTIGFVLKNARLVLSSEIVTGAVRVQDGVICDVHRGPLSSAEAVDLEGDYLIPGLIDVHTDNLERHIMPRNNAEWPVMAALVAHDAQVAAAGITTVLDSLCVGTTGVGVRSFKKVKETIALLGTGKRKQMFRSEHLLHLRAELSNEHMPSMFAEVYEDPDVLLVSLMDHTPGQRQWADLEKYLAMEKRDHKLTEQGMSELVRTLQENRERFSQPNRSAVLAMLSGRSVVLASHDDTTLEHVEEAHAEGIQISEFPTTVLAAAAAREKKMHIIAGSPNLVLGRSHSGNVSVSELARLRLLDVLSSDYAPSSLLYGAFLLAANLDMDLHEALNMVTLSPARLVGLEDRGSIEEGKRADLVRVRKVGEIPLVTAVWRAGVRVV